MPALRVPDSIFREYDLRGKAEQHLSNELFGAVGHAFVELLAPIPDRAEGRHRVAVGYDCRVSSPRLREALIEGLLDAGVDVVDVGIGPSPQLYFAVQHLRVEAGMMITGSHNAGDENGVKMLRRVGSIFGAEIQKLKHLVEAGEFPKRPRGTLEHVDVRPDYVAYMRSNIHLAPGAAADFGVVVDAGNGAAGPLALAAMGALGLKVTPLHCDMDGTFPHHHPDPTKLENVVELIAAVKRTGARVGIAFDGDGDRIGAIDADGEVVWGDRLVTLFARDILKANPGGAILGEVKCSQTMYDDVTRHGGRAIMWKTGHSLIKTKMKEEHALLAGEMSGHLFFADRHFGYDDAIYAALRLIEILVREGKTIGELLADLPRTHVTPELRLDADDAIKFLIVDAVRRHYLDKLGRERVLELDGARIQFPNGWGLVRASNTQPALVVRFEADTLEHRDAIRGEVEAVIADARAALGAAHAVSSPKR
jgi:phosphomannomutase/phosphoglucomutase